MLIFRNFKIYNKIQLMKISGQMKEYKNKYKINIEVLIITIEIQKYVNNQPKRKNQKKFKTKI